MTAPAPHHQDAQNSGKPRVWNVLVLLRRATSQGCEHKGDAEASQVLASTWRGAPANCSRLLTWLEKQSAHAPLRLPRRSLTKGSQNDPKALCTTVLAIDQAEAGICMHSGLVG